MLDELARRGIPFQGMLYAGLMMTADGPQVLEFNVRFGDPETQAMLPRLRSDLLELLEAATVPGGLADVELEWSTRDGGDRGARQRRLSGLVLARRRDHAGSTTCPRRVRSRTRAPRSNADGAS